MPAIHRRRRIDAFPVTCVISVALVAVLSLSSCRSEVRVMPLVLAAAADRPPVEGTHVKVMTLNLAHGRKDGPNQLFRSGDAIRSHLDDVAEVLRRERPTLVGLQEADGPSFWSGGFDHVQYLAEKAGYPSWTRGEHMKGAKLSYGTALLSELPLSEAVSVTFAPSPPTFTKGFVVASVQWPGDPAVAVDVVSVHLDFSRRGVRHTQALAMIEQLSQRNRPMVIVGDFNCEWNDGEDTLRAPAEALDLRAYQPDAEDLDTFPTLRKRLDWMLISPALAFSTYRVLPDVLSDHRAVIAELRLAPQ